MDTHHPESSDGVSQPSQSPLAGFHVLPALSPFSDLSRVLDKQVHLVRVKQICCSLPLCHFRFQGSLFLDLSHAHCLCVSLLTSWLVWWMWLIGGIWEASLRVFAYWGSLVLLDSYTHWRNLSLSSRWSSQCHVCNNGFLDHPPTVLYCVFFWCPQ